MGRLFIWGSDSQETGMEMGGGGEYETGKGKANPRVHS